MSKLTSDKSFVYIPTLYVGYIEIQRTVAGHVYGTYNIHISNIYFLILYITVRIIQCINSTVNKFEIKFILDMVVTTVESKIQ